MSPSNSAGGTAHRPLHGLDVEELGAAVALLHRQPAEPGALHGPRLLPRPAPSGAPPDTGYRPWRSRKGPPAPGVSRRCPGCSRRWDRNQRKRSSTSSTIASTMRPRLESCHLAAGRMDRFADRPTNPDSIEVDHLPGPLDDAQFQHVSSSSSGSQKFPALAKKTPADTRVLPRAPSCSLTGDVSAAFSMSGARGRRARPAQNVEAKTPPPTRVQVGHLRCQRGPFREARIKVQDVGRGCQGTTRCRVRAQVLVQGCPGPVMVRI